MLDNKQVSQAEILENLFAISISIVDTGKLLKKSGLFFSYLLRSALMENGPSKLILKQLTRNCKGGDRGTRSRTVAVGAPILSPPCLCFPQKEIVVRFDFL